MEIIPVVNANDEIIGYKARDEIVEEDIYRVSALWIENNKGEILLAQRGFLKKNGPWKWWAAVAGTVEKDESYDENIYKEAQEEIWLEGIEFEKVEKLYSHIHGRQFFCQYYFLLLERDIHEFTLEEWEVAAVRWFSREEIKNLYLRNPEVLASKDYIKYRFNL